MQPNEAYLLLPSRTTLVSSYRSLAFDHTVYWLIPCWLQRILGSILFPAVQQVSSGTRDSEGVLQGWVRVLRKQKQ